MAETFKTLAQMPVPNSETLIYQVPANTQGIVRQMIIANTTGSDATCTIWTTASGDSDPDDSNLMLPTTTIVAGGHGTYGGVITLAAGESIYAQGGTNNAITMSVFGVEGDV